MEIMRLGVEALSAGPQISLRVGLTIFPQRLARSLLQMHWSAAVRIGGGSGLYRFGFRMLAQQGKKEWKSLGP